jgi:hypothetical protein
LLERKFCALHKFRKERRISPRGYFKSSDTTHFIADCPKRKKFDSFNKYDYTNRMTIATRATTRRRTASGTTTTRRSSRRSYPEHVLP